MDERRISSLFGIGALTALWGLTACNGFQPAMIGIAFLLSLEMLMFAPAERQALAVREDRSAAGKAWWS